MENEHSLRGVCVACGNSIMEWNVEAIPIDGFWTCSSDCLKKYQDASKGWSAEKVLRVKQWQEQAVIEAMQPALWKQLPFRILVVINVLIIDLGCQ